jgi:hypothetical protein
MHLSLVCHHNLYRCELYLLFEVYHRSNSVVAMPHCGYANLCYSANTMCATMYCTAAAILPMLTQAAIATAGGYSVYSAMPTAITRLPAIAFPLNAVRVTALVAPYLTLFSLLNYLDKSTVPTTWFATEHSSIEHQHKAYAASLIAKFGALPLVCCYAVFGSGRAVLVPACMFYTAYTLGGISSERAHTRHV